MKEFDKTIRLVMPFALLLIAIIVIAMQLSGFSLPTSFWPTPMRMATNPLEPAWEAQIELVRVGRTDRIEVAQELIGDEQLLQLQGLTGLRELLIDNGQVTDNGVAPLTTLPRLEHLRLRGCRLHDLGFRQLCTIGSLKQLNLPQADLSDTGLESLSNLRQLELFRFSSPQVTDVGMLPISRVATLRWLHLIDIPVTDLSLKSFEEMRNLESLYLDGVRISEAGYDQLFRTRPQLHVHINQLHHDRDPHKNDHKH